jgi:hypothetical protein
VCFSADVKSQVWPWPALGCLAAWLLWVAPAALSAVSAVSASAAEAGPPVLHLSYRAPESGLDRRGDYPTAALRLALDKTSPGQGPYQLALAPPMNKLRTLKTLSDRALPNFLAVLAFDPAHAQAELDYLRFPLHFGAMGYRVCFVTPAKREAVAKATSLAELQQFSFGQGAGWTDVAVLRSNGFKVVEVATYDSLFAMLARGRFDLLCRGALEVQAEQRAHPELLLDRSFALVYPLPMFFYTHKDNQVVKQRVAAGLQIAYDDGSLLKLFNHYFREGLQMVDLPGRRIHRLSNPAVAGIDFDYRKYDLKLIEPVDGGVEQHRGVMP